MTQLPQDLVWGANEKKRTIEQQLFVFSHVAHAAPSPSFYDASPFHDVFLLLVQLHPLSWPYEHCSIIVSKYRTNRIHKYNIRLGANLLNSSLSKAVASASMSSSSLMTSLPTYFFLSLPNIFQISSLTALWEGASGGARLFAGGGDGESESEVDTEQVRLRGARPGRAPAAVFSVGFDAILLDPDTPADPEGIWARLGFRSAFGAADSFDPLFIPVVADLGNAVFFAGTPVTPNGEDTLATSTTMNENT